MSAAIETQGAVIAGGSVVNLARIETADGLLVSPDEITHAAYTVSERDPCTQQEQPVPGHLDQTIDPALTLFSELQTGPAWQVDSTGYNFRHEIDVTESPAFPIAGRTYSVLYRLTPSAGQPILFRFSIRAV